MGSQNQSLDEAMRAHNRVHLSLIPLATLVSPLLCQLKFNGGVSSSSSNSNANSPSANRNTNNNNTGRTWCYTTGRNNNCGDLQNSRRFPNNPWSYNACSNQG